MWLQSLTQCKEIEENNRMGKTRDLIKKIRDTKGKCNAKMGTIKDRNGMDLTEAEDIKKMWREYTDELYKKDLHDTDNQDGMITHLEPDILGYEAFRALDIRQKGVPQNTVSYKSCELFSSGTHVLASFISL